MTGPFEEKFANIMLIFLTKTSDKDSDPTWPKSSGSTTLHLTKVFPMRRSDNKNLRHANHNYGTVRTILLCFQERVLNLAVLSA
jgi:hypothetical protein